MNTSKALCLEYKDWRLLRNVKWRNDVTSVNVCVLMHDEQYKENEPECHRGQIWSSTESFYDQWHNTNPALTKADAI